MNSSNAPRTAREAVLTEMLGDLDQLLIRMEALPLVIDQAAARLDRSAESLERAGSAYRTSVTEFTAEAQSRVSCHLEQQAAAAGMSLDRRQALFPDNLERRLQTKPTLKASAWLDYVLVSVISALLTGAVAAWLR